MLLSSNLFFDFEEVIALQDFLTISISSLIVSLWILELIVVLSYFRKQALINCTKSVH